MFTADPFLNDVPFTDISKYTLDKYYDQYYNVYQKGALIGLCLDIRLRKLSGGKYGLQNLMLDLSKKYGKNKAFEDDKLFDEITAMTYPEIGEFFNRYVRGTERLPLKETFADVGISYSEQDTAQDYSIGITEQSIDIGEYQGKPKIRIASVANLNEMGRALNFREGDVLIAMNNDTIPDFGPEFQQFFQKEIMALPLRKEMSYTVVRTDSAGAQTVTELKSPVKKITILRRHNMEPAQNPTPEQLALRDAWLKP